MAVSLLAVVAGLLIWQPVWTLGTVAVLVAGAVAVKRNGGGGRAVIINQTVYVGRRR